MLKQYQGFALKNNKKQNNKNKNKNKNLPAIIGVIILESKCNSLSL
jgi:hypothetical protein